MPRNCQAIICLDRDLDNAARATRAGQRLKGAGGTVQWTKDEQEYNKTAMYLQNFGTQHALPDYYCTTTARLIIIAHGDPASGHIHGDRITGGSWTPEQFAQKVISWLNNNVIETISLRICFGGGRRGAAERTTSTGARTPLQTFVNQMPVKPEDSFAYKFAKNCGYATKINAFTGESTTSYMFTPEYEGEQFSASAESRVTSCKELVDGEHRGIYYKIRLFPVRGASPSAPKNPTWQMISKTQT
jgi:hypothetical protein